MLKNRALKYFSRDIVKMIVVYDYSIGIKYLALILYSAKVWWGNIFDK